MFRFLCIAAVVLAFPVVANDIGLRGHRQLDSLSVDSMELIAVGVNPTVVATLSDNVIVTIDADQQYNIRAITSGAVQSVEFRYNGELFRTENKPLWAFCGNKKTLYNACSNLMEGVHTVSATPYSETKRQGSQGGSRTITFTLSTSQQTSGSTLEATIAPSSEPTLEPSTLDPTVGPTAEPTLQPTSEPTPAPIELQLSSFQSQAPTQQPHGFSVDSMELIEAGSNRVVATLTNDAVLIIDPSKQYSINAITSGSVQSVQFSHNGLLVKTENRAVWAFCGNKKDIFNPCKELTSGAHTVTATPYPERGGQGSPGGSMTMRFILSTLAQQTSPSPTPQPATQTNENKSCKPPKFVGSWQIADQYPITLAEAQGGIIGSDFVIVSGFTNGWGQATNKNFALDMTDPNATWRSIADLPVFVGISHGAFAIVGNKFYMCGGYLGGHPGPHIDTCLVYDHDANTWDFFDPLPIGRGGGGLIYSSTKNALVYSAGAERPGRDEDEDFQHTWMYSLSNPEVGWVEKADIPYLTNHMSHVTALDQTGKERHFFLAGQMGPNEQHGNHDNNYEWDVDSESWIERQSMPFTRGHASASTNPVNCGFIIAAGTTNGSGKTSDVSYYDVPSDTWTKIGDVPQRINTPVCDIDKAGGWYYCFTGFPRDYFAWKIKMEF